MQVEVTDKYGAHVCNKSDIRCPNCGEQNVFIEQGEGDYYVGPDHYCLNCKYVFTMQIDGIKESIKFRVLI